MIHFCESLHACPAIANVVLDSSEGFIFLAVGRGQPKASVSILGLRGCAKVGCYFMHCRFQNPQAIVVEKRVVCLTLHGCFKQGLEYDEALKFDQLASINQSI